MRRLHLLGIAVLFAAVVAGACGGESPTSPSATGGVVVQGVVLGDSASVSTSSGTPTAAQNQKVTVQVEGTSITAEVGANGTFQLEGIPGGTFTLIFLVDGVEIGRVVVTAEDGSEVKVVVQVKDSTLVLVQIEVDGPDGGPSPSPSASPAACIVNGGQIGRGIELEGNVATGDYKAFEMSAAGATGLVNVSAASASFRCIGSAKEPTEDECKAAVKAPAKVHVRGTLMTCTMDKAEVTASEVKVQKD